MVSIKKRTADLLRMLVGSESYLAVGEIAAGLNVSVKTVNRDLPEAESYLASLGSGLSLMKKKGAGLQLTGSAEALRELKERLGQVKERTYSPEERLSIIVSRLLPEKEPLKLFYLSSLLGVTDGTISNDLDKLEGWFEGHGLKLVRKPGLGVYVEGEERKIRQAIIAYIYDHVTEEELLHLVQQSLRPESGDRADRASSYLLDLVDKEILHRLDLVIVGDQPERILVENVKAINSNTNLEGLLAAFVEADIVTTAIGPNILKFIAPNIAKGLAKRLETNKQPLNIIACENMVGGSTVLKNFVYEHLEEGLKEEAMELIGFPDAAVDRIVPLQNNDEPLLVKVEPYAEWDANVTQAKGEPPGIEGLTWVENLEAYI